MRNLGPASERDIRNLYFAYFGKYHFGPYFLIGLFEWYSDPNLNSPEYKSCLNKFKILEFTKIERPLALSFTFSYS